jgi:jumonji domain-containing protein 2
MTSLVDVQEPSSKSKQKRSGFKAQASALANESKVFLERSGRTTAYRASTYRPTLEKFKSTSFSDYVRGVLMGVPIDVVGKEDPYVSDAEETEESDMDSAGESPPPAMDNYVSIEDKAIAPQDTSSGDPQPLKSQRMSARVVTTRSKTGSVTTTSTNNIYSKHYPSMTEKQTKERKPSYLKPDNLKLSDGIAKIIPPEGWCSKVGIGNDTTGRGEIWQKGNKLGDMIISSPIKQCISGIGGVYDFTMMEQPTISVAGFREKADAYRVRQMGNATDDDESDEHMDLLARKFWKRLGPTMEASQYGADMEGTLFDGEEACGWNVDQLESCLALLEADYKNSDELEEQFRLPGVTSAYLYFGMWASVFSAHTEDMNLLSINYLHAGAPKYWYAIAQEDSHRFESLMSSMFSHLSTSCPEFLRHKRSLLSPSLLQKAGISYTTMVQRAGDIIITFPGSYHFGFNTGFNCAESTNFAVPEWVPFGKHAKICMCHPHSVRIDMSRFESLLNLYEDAMRKRIGPPLTYSEWTKEFIRSKKRKLRKIIDNQSVDEGVSKRSKGQIVEIMKLHAGKGSDQGRTSRKKKVAVAEEFRRALPIRKAQLAPNVKVICLLQCDDGVECYFSGVIADVVENHAKVHFIGSAKSEDVWLTVESGQLFLDGGAVDSS